MTRLFTTLSISAAALLASTLSFANIATGENVSDMTVKTASGEVHNLSDFAGKRVVLEWTNHGCPYVKKHYETNNMQD